MEQERDSIPENVGEQRSAVRSTEGLDTLTELDESVDLMIERAKYEMDFALLRDLREAKESLVNLRRQVGERI